MNWGVAQEVEYLLCQVQTPVPPKKKKKERERKGKEVLDMI
jgi:hypothetical protein